MCDVPSVSAIHPSATDLSGHPHTPAASGRCGAGGERTKVRPRVTSVESRVANVSAWISIIVSLLLHVPYYYEIMPTPLSLTVRSNRVNTQQ